MTTERIRHAVAAIEQIKAILADKDLGVRGAILASLLTEWLADQPDLARQAIFDLHVGMVREQLDQRVVRKG